MKAKSIIFLSVGIFLILLNVITDIMAVNEPSEDLAYSIGSLIGSHLFGIVGIVFIGLAIKNIRKENKKRKLISDYETGKEL